MKNHYGFEFESGRKTTTGTPNIRTGHHNIAGKLAVFPSQKQCDDWVENGKETSDMRGNCRKSVTREMARKLHLGMSICDFAEWTSDLKSRMEIDIDRRRKERIGNLVREKYFIELKNSAEMLLSDLKKCEESHLSEQGWLSVKVLKRKINAINLLLN